MKQVLTMMLMSIVILSVMGQKSIILETESIDDYELIIPVVIYSINNNNSIIQNVNSNMEEQLLIGPDWAPDGLEIQQVPVATAKSSVAQGDKGTFIDPRDGKVYKWVRIGEQVWMAENLVFRPVIGNYWVYNNVHSYALMYGYLYDWETARRACPPGWHLPSDAEWTQLTKFVGSNPGTKLIASNWGDNEDVTGESGFSALPGGNRDVNGSFSFIGFLGTWWSATEGMSMFAWSRYIDRHTGNVLRSSINKAYGLSMRCVMDNVRTEDE